MPITILEDRGSAGVCPKIPELRVFQPVVEAGKDDQPVISLKKYLDLDPDELKKFIDPQPTEAEPDDLLSSTLDCYRSTLTTMGTWWALACPTLGAELQDNLTRLAGRLSKKLTANSLQHTKDQVDEQLQKWGGRTVEYFKGKANEVKELLIVLARTAESVAERDQRHASHFNQLTKRLQAIANLEDLSEIRSSLVESATELKTCVDKMVQDGHESVVQLQKQVTTYQAKLEQAEQSASRDPLTGLDNRPSVQRKMEHRIGEKRTFCAAILDLNNFKRVNDMFGHPAGDDLLKQFATELRSSMRPTDVVGRWGGDEFVMVLDCDLAEAGSRVERVQKWVSGDYTLQGVAGSQKIPMDAAVGVVQWQPGETVQGLVERADTAMYRQKSEMLRRSKQEIAALD
jgi:diguanylate cyclase (GGDEF)-like protein